MRERIAIVLQDAMLFGGTVAENLLRYGRLDATFDDVQNAARAAHAHDFIMRLHGYDTPLAEAGGSLSGGERQRLSIARPAERRADPDPRRADIVTRCDFSEAAVFDAFRRLRQAAPRSSSHIACPPSRTPIAFSSHEGRIAAQGTHAELLSSNQLYRRMCARLSIGKPLDDRDVADVLEPAI